jgi:Zn-finger nucleic acid-binding protein
MICPVCKKDMFVVEYKQIELDYCQSCKGVWFDAGELELLLEVGGLKASRQSLGDVMHLLEAHTSEKKSRCPICAKNMKKVGIGSETGVIIDACIQNDGLWFDAGEVASLVKIIAERSTVKKETESEIMGFLRDVFQSK